MEIVHLKFHILFVIFCYPSINIVNKMSKSSDDIIILSDEEDEVQIESVVAPKRSKTSNHPPALAPPPPSRTKTSPTLTKRTRTPILVLTEPKSLSYGIERGYKLKCIHGVKRLTNEEELMYLIEYESCDDYEFVPSNILRRYGDENLLIEYLEKITRFID